MDIKGVIKNVAKSFVKLIGYKIIIIPLIVLILFGAFKWVIDKTIVKASAEAITGCLNIGTKIEENQIKIEDSVYQEILDKLAEQGITDPESLYLDPSQGYIQKYVLAETVTSYPKMGTEGTQGIINFIRKDVDFVETLMTYMPYDEFNSIVQEQSYTAYEKIRNYFSIDMETMDAIVATYSSTSGSEHSYNISTQRISYKNQVAKYIVPFEFLISLLQVSQNPEFVVSLADMVINNSKIDYTIQDCLSKITTTDVYTYDEVTSTPEYGESGELVNIGTETNSKTENKGSVTKEVNSILPYISEVDTWIVNATQYYDKVVTPVNNTSTEELENEQVSSTIYRINRKITTTENGEIISCVGGVSVSNSEATVSDSSTSSYQSSAAVGKVATMINWAEQQIGKTQYTGRDGLSIAKNYCAKFVSNCYWAGGFKYLGGNANAMNNLGTHYGIDKNADGSINCTNIPIGACLISLKGTYGHVAIYAGNGYVIEAGVSPIRKIEIDKACYADTYAYWALRKRIRTIYGNR